MAGLRGALGLWAALAITAAAGPSTSLPGVVGDQVQQHRAAFNFLGRPEDTLTRTSRFDTGPWAMESEDWKVPESEAHLQQQRVETIAKKKSTKPKEKTTKRPWKPSDSHPWKSSRPDYQLSSQDLKQRKRRAVATSEAPSGKVKEALTRLRNFLVNREAETIAKKKSTKPKEKTTKRPWKPSDSHPWKSSRPDYHLPSQDLKQRKRRGVVTSEAPPGKVKEALTRLRNFLVNREAETIAKKKSTKPKEKTTKRPWKPSDSHPWKSSRPDYHLPSQDLKQRKRRAVATSEAPTVEKKEKKNFLSGMLKTWKEKHFGGSERPSDVTTPSIATTMRIPTGPQTTSRTSHPSTRKTTVETTTRDRSIITAPLKTCPEGQRMSPNRTCVNNYTDPEGSD